MTNITEKELTAFIEQHIQTFHKRRIESILQLKLDKILKRKNPYLFKAKDITTPEMLVRSLLEAHLSSQEEGIFGEFLENLAIFICGKVYGGKKSVSEGIDLEFLRDGVEYIVSIKSGPNWGNSNQIKKMREDFKKARQRRRANTSKVKIVPVNGCCYGKNGIEDKGDYLKKCGQSFWSFVSGSDELYIDIIKPLGYQAKQRNHEFQVEYAKVVGRFTKQFIEMYCSSDGSTILWNKIVELNSAISSLTEKHQKY